jgi:hypothetical protein
MLKGDGYDLWEASDNVSMPAVAIAIGGDDALSKFETTWCSEAAAGGLQLLAGRWPP